MPPQCAARTAEMWASRARDASGRSSGPARSSDRTAARTGAGRRAGGSGPAAYAVSAPRRNFAPSSATAPTGDCASAEPRATESGDGSLIARASPVRYSSVRRNDAEPKPWPVGRGREGRSPPSASNAAQTRVTNSGRDASDPSSAAIASALAAWTPDLRSRRSICAREKTRARARETDHSMTHTARPRTCRARAHIRQQKRNEEDTRVDPVQLAKVSKLSEGRLRALLAEPGHKVVELRAAGRARS